uniref:Reverse transcriptase Ty1/copia-type domain-containing protein n=1 Tax=Solanum lycopersicum TaxID=4081 RepID=A0A3Q7EHE9_SOLLC
MTQDTKEALQTAFKINDMRELRYFLGIEFARSKDGILMHQRKYDLELVADMGLAGAKPVTTPMPQNRKLTTAEFDQHIPPAHEDQSLRSHTEAALRLIRYVKYATGLGILMLATSDDHLKAMGLPPFLWKSKKQATVSRNSAEAEYWAMVSSDAEIA